MRNCLDRMVVLVRQRGGQWEVIPPGHDAPSLWPRGVSAFDAAIDMAQRLQVHRGVPTAVQVMIGGKLIEVARYGMASAAIEPGLAL